MLDASYIKVIFSILLKNKFTSLFLFKQKKVIWSFLKKIFPYSPLFESKYCPNNDLVLLIHEAQKPLYNKNMIFYFPLLEFAYFVSIIYKCVSPKLEHVLYITKMLLGSHNKNVRNFIVMSWPSSYKKVAQHWCFKNKKVRNITVMLRHVWNMKVRNIEVML